ITQPVPGNRGQRRGTRRVFRKVKDWFGRKAGLSSTMHEIRTDESSRLHRTARQGGPAARLLPIMAAVFIAFLVIGLAMPVLPLHVHQGLGHGTFLVGLAAGSQFAAAIVSRVWAGRHADARGAKHAVIAGLLTAAAAGLLYLLSLS